jgi:hypothetical protein
VSVQSGKDAQQRKDGPQLQQYERRWVLGSIVARSAGLLPTFGMLQKFRNGRDQHPRKRKANPSHASTSPARHCLVKLQQICELKKPLRPLCYVCQVMLCVAVRCLSVVVCGSAVDEDGAFLVLDAIRVCWSRFIGVW